MKRLALMCLASFSPIMARAATIVVPPAPPGQFAAIQAAVDAAQPGDEILFLPGQYLIDRNVSVSNKKALKIKSDAGRGATSVEFPDQPVDCSAVFRITDSSVDISGLSLSRASWAISAARSSLNISNCLIFYNSVSALSIEDGSTSLRECLIHSNQSGVHHNTGSRLCISRCSFIANLVGALSIGGRVSADIKNSIFLANTGLAGVISCGTESSVRISDSVIAGNAAKRPAIIKGGPQVSVVNSTFVSNRTYEPSFLGTGPTYINCIIWDNDPPRIHGEVITCLTDTDPRFIDEGRFDFDAPVTLIGGCGSIFTLVHYVIEQPDYHLREDSPAIDIGLEDQASPSDLDGKRRPCGDGIDIGAYEFGDCPAEPLFVRGDPDGSGQFDLADPIAILQLLFSSAPGVVCRKAADMDDDGKLIIGDPIWLLNHLFASGPPPRPPTLVSDIDPTRDDLSCDSYPPCDP